MGGKALQVPTRRYQRKEFDFISEELLEILSKTFSDASMPLFYNNKESFGDADIVVSTKNFSGDITDYIQKTFNPKEINKNGNVFSFDYKELQVDLILVSEENYKPLVHFLSYNDLGNFLGRLAHTQGLKYGMEGLWCEHIFKGLNIGTVMISTDQRKIYEFLGLSYERYERGFDDLEDIFEFIASSKFFNWKKFQYDELNSINRKRNAKRKSYELFLEWMLKNVADKNHEYVTNETQEEKNKKTEKFFPESKLESNIRKLEYAYTKELYVKSKFNGTEVMRRFGLRGKELGDAMKDFKNADSFETYIINNPEERIYTDFEEFLKNRKR